MKIPITPQPECDCLPILSSQAQGWENILVEQFQHPSGEGRTYYSDEHTICLSLAPRPVRFLQIKGGKTHTSLYGKGDISITPAQMPFFARWDGDDYYLQIRITSRFIQQVAREALSMNPDQLELLPEFRTRDPHIESIGMLLLAELKGSPEPPPALLIKAKPPQLPEVASGRMAGSVRPTPTASTSLSKLKQENLGGKLYIESLANVFAVHLLRQYAAAKPKLPRYEGGLPQRQLLQILDYINDHLDRDIKLADLAALLDMSQFHFSHLFKQAIGTAPHQYLLQQRIERAKQLLKQTDQSVMDIALLCGFNSHSHLSKQFRQLTGVTPRAYRAK